MVSKSGVRSVPGWSSSRRRRCRRGSRYRGTAHRAASCVASSSMKSSSTSSCTRSGSASGRSILLMTTIGCRPSASAFRITNRVCGIGPSAASTRSRTPSTMRRMRSTSPPKSAWPGVSTMLILVPLPADRGVLGQDRDAALALERVGVHHALGDLLVGPERAGLPEHLVDERGLAVVDVRDDGDVANAIRHCDSGARDVLRRPEGPARRIYRQ